MKTQRRWLKSVIAAAAELTTPLPFARATRRRIAVRVQPQTKARGLAAR